MRLLPPLRGLRITYEYSAPIALLRPSVAVSLVGDVLGLLTLSSKPRRVISVPYARLAFPLPKSSLSPSLASARTLRLVYASISRRRLLEYFFLLNIR